MEQEGAAAISGGHHVPVEAFASRTDNICLLVSGCTSGWSETLQQPLG